MKTPIRIALTVYVLVAIVKKQLKVDLSLYSMLEIFKLALFEKTPLFQMFSPMNSDQNQADFFLAKCNYAISVGTILI